MAVDRVARAFDAWKAAAGILNRAHAEHRWPTPGELAAVDQNLAEVDEFVGQAHKRTMGGMTARAAWHPPHPTDQDGTDAAAGDTTPPTGATGDQDDLPDDNTLGAGKT